MTDLNLLAVRLPSGAVDALKADSRVASVEADAVRTLMDRKGSVRSSGRLAAGNTETVPFDIPMVQADQLTFKAAGAKKVCINDAGYDLSREDLQKTNVAGVDLTSTQRGDWNPGENSHGTHVAGTNAALGGNGAGVVGVVPTGTLPLFIAKVFDTSGSASSSAIINGVRQCSRAGAKIISMSLGGGRPTSFEERTYQRMADRGILVIAAAGDAGDTTASLPAGYSSVMSVAGFDINMVKAGFSQTNADVEIAAPGDPSFTLAGIATTILSVGATQADGLLRLAQAGTSATVAVSADPSNHAFFDGTSMATPHVSGVAALLWSNHSSCTAAQIRSTLQKSAMDLGTAGRDNNFGFGLVQAKAASDRIATLGCAN